jgi:hypothetical protein
MTNITDLADVRFGSLVVQHRIIDRKGPSITRSSQWCCRCDCGSQVSVPEDLLLARCITSCGCRGDFSIQSMRLSLYRTWANMIRRCYVKSCPSYPHYGGRGIRVCDRWVDFCAFAMDMGEKPDPSYSLDRIDTNGHYEPSNCRWASTYVQSRNKRNNRWVTYQGKSVCISDLAKRLGISVGALNGRIRRGWAENTWSDPVRQWSSKAPSPQASINQTIAAQGGRQQ